MPSDGKRQYTIKAIPSEVDRRLRQRAEQEDKSLNDVAVEALRRGLELEAEEIVYDDLDELIGTWEDDPEFDSALAQQYEVDHSLWR